jgi:hypothetical protein
MNHPLHLYARYPIFLGYGQYYWGWMSDQATYEGTVTLVYTKAKKEDSPPPPPLRTLGTRNYVLKFRPSSCAYVSEDLFSSFDVCHVTHISIVSTYACIGCLPSCMPDACMESVFLQVSISVCCVQRTICTSISQYACNICLFPFSICVCVPTHEYIRDRVE